MLPTSRDYNALTHHIKVLRYSPVINPDHADTFDQWVQGVALWLSNQNPRFDIASFMAATRHDVPVAPRETPDAAKDA
jgi:hypothetical protein